MLKVQSLFFQIGEIGSHFPEHGNFFPRRQRRSAGPVLAAALLGKREMRKKAAFREERGLLARLKGFEPPTCRLGGGRSIQLSYKRRCFCYCTLPACPCQCEKGRKVGGRLLQSAKRRTIIIRLEQKYLYGA